MSVIINYNIEHNGLFLSTLILKSIKGKTLSIIGWGLLVGSYINTPTVEDIHCGFHGACYT